jgi:Bifunctional DNA primase/polymerase, N-terminal
MNRGRTLLLAEAACAYHEQGFAVLPLLGKSPHAALIKKTHGRPSTNRLAAQGADEEQLRFWFATPDANIGVFCGEPSGGLVVVDLDDCAFPPPGARLPLTPTVKTGRAGRGGYHLYYRCQQPVQAQKFAWGEVRGYPRSPNGTPLYVVAPPSRHPDTNTSYRWQLPLDQVPIADFADVELPTETRSPHPRQTAHASPERNNQIRPTKAVLLRPCTTTDGRNRRWLASFDADPNAVTAMARALGITAPLGSPFPCILHPEQHASAALHLSAETGHWLYHDFHSGSRGAPEWMTLAQLRARKAGRGQKLNAPEHGTWKLILLVEAGILPLVEITARPLPKHTSGLVKHVYERFLFLLGCRWNYDYGEPTPFERNFAAALCQTSERHARSAINQLQRLQQIQVAGHAADGRTRLWLPTGEGHEPDRGRP